MIRVFIAPELITDFLTEGYSTNGKSITVDKGLPLGCKMYKIEFRTFLGTEIVKKKLLGVNYIDESGPLYNAVQIDFLEPGEDPLCPTPIKTKEIFLMQRHYRTL